MAPPAAAPLLTAGEVSSCLAAAVGSWLLFRQLVVLVLGSGVAVAAGGVGCLAAGSSSRLLAISWLLFLAGDQLTVLQLLLAPGSSSDSWQCWYLAVELEQAGLRLVNGAG